MKAAPAASPGSRPRRASLTRQLLLWSLGALAVVWGSFVVMGYQTGVHEADELTDGHLASVAALLLNLRAHEAAEGTQITQRVNPPGLKSHDYQQSLSVFQWDAEGRMLHHIGSAPVPPFNSSEGFADLVLGPGGVVWRSFSQWDAARSRRITVLLELRERDALAEDIAEQMIEPGLWLLPVVSLALGLALWRGLRPLYALSADVAALDPASTHRLASRHAWNEFESVVASINTLLDRQQAAMVRERRLANEVAHELRTPLSSIALQASALGGELDDAARHQAIERIGQDALRAGHVLNQLLALARASRAELHEATAPVDLCAVAREVCGDYAQMAWQRGDEIALSAPAELWVPGHAVLLDIAARNLVENALKHTPRGTRIAVQVGASDDKAGETEVATGAWLQVCDDGARREPAEGASPGAVSPVDSLHLGHEILRRVADIHGGRFGPAVAPAPFTTCYRLDLPTSPAAAPG
jgi:two-component system sensor histidine kinase QseC